MNKHIKIITTALHLVFISRSYLLAGMVSFVTLTSFYFFLLPATYTGGRVGWVSLRFLSPTLAAFAVAFSFALSLIMLFAHYSFRKRKGKKYPAMAGSFVGSVLPPLLCCSPVLPSLAALVGGFMPFAFRLSGFLQGFIATYETPIFIGITAVLAHAVYCNAKQVILAESAMCER